MSEIDGAMREDTWKYTVIINGLDTGVWDAKDGGEIDSNQTQYRPGGMADPIALGGARNVGNVTLRRNYRLGRDHQASQRFIDWAGKADVKIVGQALDHDGHNFGVPFTYNGTLKRYTPPTHDSTSDSPAMVEIEVVVDGFPSGMSKT